jgi:hypothetical protein
MGSVKKKRKKLGDLSVSAKEVRELCKLAWVHDVAISTRSLEARVLPDGRVLMWLADGVKGFLHPSRASAEEAHREYVEACRQAAEERAKGLVDPAVALLPPIDDFLRDVEAHAKSLGPRLRIPDEVLDFTPASLDAVDKALKRIPWAKREAPDLVTPLVAYLGEVIRRGCGGQWTKMLATTRKREVSVYDPVELAAYNAAKQRLTTAAHAAAQKAETEARARRASAADVLDAVNAAHGAVYKELWTIGLQPIRVDVIEETINDHENEPMIKASRGRLFQPFASVFIPIHEPSKRIPLRSADGVPYPPPPRPAV